RRCVAAAGRAHDARAQPGDPRVPDPGVRAAALGDRGAARGGRRQVARLGSPGQSDEEAAMASMRLPRPRHGGSLQTTLERNAIFMPWVSIVLTTFWTRMLYLDDEATLDAKLGHAAREASDELSAIALRYAVIDGKELTVAKEAARTHPVKAS